MYRSQLELVLSRIYRREKDCIRLIEDVRKAQISSHEAVLELFPKETPQEEILCFFFLVKLGNELVSEVIEDLGRRGVNVLSVDEALLILEDEIKNKCKEGKIIAA